MTREEMQIELAEKIGTLCVRYNGRHKDMVASDVMIALAATMVTGIKANSVDKKQALNAMVAYMAMELNADA